ncbi:hypothetical protein THOM_1352 [Trachipleistophora hominis]|uniref:Uncharacterized protein n=1 Tax=Trachipleistophora hominis TaxID=72359 RepID=L7JWL8_TRAHO|nr:hypothetical protein THOM_1352 [Trachipleistophora hominis]
MEQLSFSSQLNAPPNIKTIKEYEAENEQLKTENFQLMHQLSYYRNRGDADMQLVNKNDVESLELENAQLKKQISAMIEENNKRMKLDEERNQELLGYKVRERNYVARESEYKKAMENYKSIETEFMEKEKKYSKMISDLRAAEKNLNDQMKEYNNMIEQLTMQNKVHVEKNNYLEKKLEDTMCVLEALREDNNDNITNLSKLNEQKKFYDNIISEQAEKIKNLEVNNNFLRNEVKNAGTASHLRDEENKRLLNENKHIKDLLEDERKRMNDNMNEMEGMKLRTEQNNRIELENTKRKAQQLAAENTKLSSAISELENKLEGIRNEYEKILKNIAPLKVSMPLLSTSLKVNRLMLMDINKK